MAKAKKKGKGILEILGAGLVAVALLAIYGWQQYRTSPFLDVLRGEEWKTICQGEGRVYRLHSTSGRRKRQDGSRTAKDHNRGLRFLGADGEVLYRTGRYELRSLEQDGVWRFQYSPEDTRLAGRKDQAAVLHGDELTFEIAGDLLRLAVIRKEAPPLRLPCEPAQLGMFDRFLGG